MAVGIRSVLLVMLFSYCSAQNQQRELPCPNAFEIAPCVCTVLPSGVDMAMDCSNVESNQQLVQVFSASFPFTVFESLTIKSNKNLTTIREGDLGTVVTFEEIYINYGVLRNVQANAFATSHSTVTILDLSVNEITTFPFEEISLFTKLEELVIHNNAFKDFPQLGSRSLKILHMSSNPIKSMNSTALNSLPSIEEVKLFGLELSKLDPGTFVGLPQLRYVDVAYNHFSRVEAGTIVLTYDGVTSAYFHNNDITDVDIGAIQGVTDLVFMDGNDLEELPQQVWGPLFTGDFLLRAPGNPLKCGCDLAWIVTDENNLNHLSGDTQCANLEFVDELDPSIFINLC